MTIDRSTCSNAPARGGDKARETEWSALVAGEGRGFLPDCEGASLSASEPDSASLRDFSQWPPSQRLGGLTFPVKQRSRATGELSGVIGVCAHRKRNRVNRETSLVSVRPRSGGGQRVVGNHNHDIGQDEESAGQIVARKRVKVRGAKKPCCKHANNKRGEAA
jgi:hypothetical protein